MNDFNYFNCEGFENYTRGPILGNDGRYKYTVDADVIDYTCPTCNQLWPNAPDIALSKEEEFLWVEGLYIPIKRMDAIAILEVLVESFGRFVPRHTLIDLAFSDQPDCDIPNVNNISKAINYLRQQLKPTRLIIPNKVRHGYRLTTKDTDKEFQEKEMQRLKLIRDGKE